MLVEQVFVFDHVLGQHPNITMEGLCLNNIIFQNLHFEMSCLRAFINNYLFHALMIKGFLMSEADQIAESAGREM